MRVLYRADQWILLFNLFLQFCIAYPLLGVWIISITNIMEILITKPSFFFVVCYAFNLPRFKISIRLPWHIETQGLEAKVNLLGRHGTYPFLDEKEKQALESFSSSDSWAKKFAKRRDLKMTGARVKELSEEDVNEYHQSLKQMATRVKQAGPGYEEVAMLIRQAAEKLLCASIIHSTASHRLMGNIAVSNSRNDKSMNQESKSRSQAVQLPTMTHHYQQTNDEASKLQSEQVAPTHILRDSLNTTTPIPDDHPLSPSVLMSGTIGLT